MRLYYRFFALLTVLVMLTGLVFADQPVKGSAAAPDATGPADTGPIDTGPIDTEPTEPSDTEPTEPTEPIETDPTEPTEPTEPPVPDEVTHVKYINGNEDGSFLPNKSLSRAEMAQIVYNLGDYEDGEPVFDDVPENAWYTRAINALASAGILEGFEDGLCHPANSVNRAQFVTVLSRLSGITEAQTPSTFPDVRTTHWAYQAIAVAQEQGWVEGYEDGTFRPNNSLTRAEAVTMLNRFLGRIPDREAIDSADDLRFFPDVRPGKWYYYDVMEASVTHTARIQTDPPGETWTGVTADYDPIADGFYCIGGRLYVAENGALVHRAQEGVCGGVAWVCTGEDGICTVEVSLLTLADGSLALIRDSIPLYAPGKYPAGFYRNDATLYASAGGYLLRTEGTRTVKGYTVRCLGESGACEVDAEVLVLVEGEIVFLEDSALQTLPGAYADGFHVRDGAIYAVEEGRVVNESKTGSVSGVSYTCEGPSGKCSVSGRLLTAADGRIHLLSDGSAVLAPGLYPFPDGLYCVQSDGTVLMNGTSSGLSFGANGKYTCGNSTIDAFVDNIVSSCTNNSMTQLQMLRACHNYVRNHVSYQSWTHVEQGADCSQWAETYMLRLISRGKGNCYCYASEMYYIALRLGYWQAKGISGAVITQTYDHGWLEIKIGGVEYIFDPQLESTRGLSSGALFMKTYAEVKSMGFEHFKK